MDKRIKATTVKSGLTMIDARAEIEALYQGQIIWSTKDYLTQGIRKLKFCKQAKEGENRLSVWAVDKTAIWVTSALEEDAGLIDSFILAKPHWHSSPMDAWNHIITLTFREQVRLLEAQQRAAKQLFGDKD